MSKHYLDFGAYAVCESDEEADRLFEALSAATEDILCGGKGPDHACPREWTSGGRHGPVKDEEPVDGNCDWPSYS